MAMGVFLAIALSGSTAVVANADVPSVISNISACRSVVPVDARLECYEKTTAILEKAITARDVRIVERRDLATARRSLFGFALPRRGLLGEDSDDTPQFAEINTTIRGVRQVASGRIEIRLTDNDEAVWQTTDPIAFPPQIGSKIRIRKGALGNYFLFMDGRSYRGMRVR